MVRITFNDNGFRELLTSAATTAMLKGHADRVCRAANAVPSTTVPAATEPYYEVQEASDSDRARFRVRAAGRRAVRHEAKTQALLKGLGGA